MEKKGRLIQEEDADVGAVSGNTNDVTGACLINYVSKYILYMERIAFL